MSTKQVNGSLFGCLPFLFGILLLCGLGVCGKTCQQPVLDGVHALREAAK